MRDTAPMLGRPLRALIVGLLASALAGGIAATGALDRLEAISVDERFAVRGADPPPRDVLLVEIDDATFNTLGFPFPRRLHAEAIDALLGAGARGVAYDVQFSEPSPRPAGDRALLRAAGDRRVVFGVADLARDGRPLVMPELARAAPGRVGNVFFPIDDDGVWRRFAPSFHGSPHMATLAAGGAKDDPERPIDYAGPQDTVERVSFLDLLDGRVADGQVRGRIAVVGATAEALLDRHPTPFGGQTSGPEINANAIQTILDGYPLRDAPGALLPLLLLAGGLLAPLASTLPRAPMRALLAALGAGVVGISALLLTAQLAFDGGTIVPLAAPLTALLLGTLGAVTLTYAVEVRAQRRLRTELERFVAPVVARELLTRATPLDSRRVEATVLFCDLRGFTSLAERLEAEQVIALLNRYLELVSAAVLDRGGTVVSYQGDGVMAVFGAPLAQPDHAARALEAAWAIVEEALPTFNRAVDGPALRACVGLNTGLLMAGVIGSERRVEYAAVGDVTNVAARLQGLGREFEARLFVAAATVEALGDPKAAERLERHGDVLLKGRREPVTVWLGR